MCNCEMYASTVVIVDLLECMYLHCTKLLRERGLDTNMVITERAHVKTSCCDLQAQMGQQAPSGT